METFCSLMGICEVMVEKVEGKLKGIESVKKVIEGRRRILWIFDVDYKKFVLGRASRKVIGITDC